MASRPFINYPAPKEAEDLTYTWLDDKNPTIRGLTLAIAATM